MQKNHLKKMFKLEGYVLDKVEYFEERILLYCHLQSKNMTYKGERSNYINARRTRQVPHMMLENQIVYLVVEQRRFYFPKHKVRHWEKLPDVGKRKQTTNTFRLHTLRELQRDNYSGSGKKRHMSGMFPMKLLDELEIKFEWREGIQKVGLDGKGVKKGRLIHHLADLGKGKSICLLPNLSQKEFKKNSWKFPMRID